MWVICPSLLLNPNQQKHMASHIALNNFSGKALKLDCWCQRQPNFDGHCKNCFRHLPHYLFAPLLGWTINKKQRTLRTQSWMLHVFWSLFKIGTGWYGSQSGYLSGHTKFGRVLQENHPCFGNPVILTPNAQLIPDVWWPLDYERRLNPPSKQSKVAETSPIIGKEWS